MLHYATLLTRNITKRTTPGEVEHADLRPDNPDLPDHPLAGRQPPAPSELVPSITCHGTMLMLSKQHKHVNAY